MGLAISLFAVSCKKNAEPTQTQQDTVAVSADTLSAQMDSVAVVEQEEVLQELNLQTFNRDSQLPAKFNENLDSWGRLFLYTNENQSNKTNGNYYAFIDFSENDVAIIKVNGTYEKLKNTTKGEYIENRIYENNNFRLELNLSSKNVSQRAVAEFPEGSFVMKGSFRLLDLNTNQETTKQTFAVGIES